MSLKLKNRNVLPLEHETITVLGLEIPITTRLPFGAQVEILDLQTKLNDGELGQFEWLMRAFCLFTRRLPKNQQVRYEWLAAQDLESDEIAELTSGTLKLLQALRTDDAAGEVGEGNAPKAPKAKSKS